MKKMNLFLGMTLVTMSSLFVACRDEVENIPEADSNDTRALVLEPHQTSFFVATDRHTNDGYTCNNLLGLLRTGCSFSQYPAPSVVVLGGDLVGAMDEAEAVSSQNNAPSLTSGVKLRKGGGGSDAPEFYWSNLTEEIMWGMGNKAYKFLGTYGSHDDQCKDGYSVFYSGPQEQDGYYTYGISYSQMINCEKTSTLLDKDDPYGQNATQASAAFTNWVNSLDKDDHKPIMVISHVPMHARRGDNYGSMLWVNALNEAAKEHDIVFFWGHNHTGESLADTNSYFLVPGDVLNVQTNQEKKLTAEESAETGKTSKRLKASATGEDVTLNFYYANAGYLKNGWDEAHLVTFTDDENDGKYDTMELFKFKSDGSTSEAGTTGKTYPYTVNLMK